MAADRSIAVRSEGLCHGLPVISESRQGLNAIVVGASGMSGQSMIDVLIKNSSRWTNIYAVSRRPPQVPSGVHTVKHVPIDLLKPAEETARTLRNHGVQADVVFFFGYVQLSNEERKYSAGNTEAAQKLSDTNGMMSLSKRFDHRN